MEKIIKLLEHFIELYENKISNNTIIYNKYKKFTSFVNNKFDSILTRGCIAYGLEINNKMANDYTEEELNDLLFILVRRLALDHGNYSIIETLIETYGIYDCDNTPCEQCGDTVETFELNL